MLADDGGPNECPTSLRRAREGVELVALDHVQLHDQLPGEAHQLVGLQMAAHQDEQGAAKFPAFQRSIPSRRPIKTMCAMGESIATPFVKLFWRVGKKFWQLTDPSPSHDP